MNLRSVLCVCACLCVGYVASAPSYPATTRRSTFSHTTRRSLFSHTTRRPMFSHTTRRTTTTTTTRRYTTPWQTYRPPYPVVNHDKPKPSAPILEPTHSQKNYGWQDAYNPSHPTTVKNIGWHSPQTTPPPIGWHVNPSTPAPVFYPAVNPMYSNRPLTTTIRYSPVAAPTVSYSGYTTTSRPWFTTRTTRRPWFTTTTTRRPWYTTTLPPPVFVHGAQSRPPMYPSYPGMQVGYPGGYPGYQSPYHAYPGYPPGPPAGHPVGNSMLPPFVPPYSGYGAGYGASPFGFGGYGVQKEKKSFFDSPAATVGTVFAGLALWELAKNRNNYQVYTGKQMQTNERHHRFVPANDAALVPGEIYFVMPPGAQCTFGERVTTVYNHLRMECKSAEPFNATVILPANATAIMPCNVTRKVESVTYTPSGEARTETSYECRGELSVRKAQMKPIPYKKFTEMRVYSTVYRFCNATILHRILENSTSDGAVLSNSSLVDGVFAMNVTNTTSFTCHVPPPHLNPFQPFPAMTYFYKTGNPYHPFGYLFPPPYLPPGYSFCNATVMDAHFKNSTNATVANATATNSTGNATADKAPIMPCVPINPRMYPHMPVSHQFYKTKYWFCNATMMDLILERNATTNKTDALAASNGTTVQQAASQSVHIFEPADSGSTKETPALTYVTEPPKGAENPVVDAAPAKVVHERMCVPLPPHMYAYPADVYPYLPAYGFPYPNIPSGDELFMVKLIPPPNPDSNATKKVQPADKMKESLTSMKNIDMKTVRVLAESVYLGPLFKVLQV